MISPAHQEGKLGRACQMGRTRERWLRKWALDAQQWWDMAPPPPTTPVSPHPPAPPPPPPPTPVSPHPTPPHTPHPNPQPPPHPTPQPPPHPTPTPPRSYHGRREPSGTPVLPPITLWLAGQGLQVEGHWPQLVVGLEVGGGSRKEHGSNGGSTTSATRWKLGSCPWNRMFPLKIMVYLSGDFDRQVTRSSSLEPLGPQPARYQKWV